MARPNRQGQPPQGGHPQGNQAQGGGGPRGPRRVNCFSCNQPLASPQARFCGACGASQVEKCQRCGKENPASQRFCGFCGADTQAANPSPVIPPIPAFPLTKCPTCGQQVPEGEFCLKCGAFLSARMVECPHCRKLTFEGVEFCGRCGKSLTATAPPPAPSQVACPRCKAQVPPGTHCVACGGSLAPTIPCPHCGGDTPNGGKFCRHCGREVEVKAAPPKPACPHCGTEVEPGTKFCPRCAKPVSGKVLCPHCGKETKLGSEFCAECGKAVDSGVKVNPAFQRLCNRCGRPVDFCANHCPHCRADIRLLIKIGDDVVRKVRVLATGEEMDLDDALARGRFGSRQGIPWLFRVNPGDHTTGLKIAEAEFWRKIFGSEFVAARHGQGFPAQFGSLEHLEAFLAKVELPEGPGLEPIFEDPEGDLGGFSIGEWAQGVAVDALERRRARKERGEPGFFGGILMGALEARQRQKTSVAEGLKNRAAAKPEGGDKGKKEESPKK